ncbi:MAG: RHS repeat-associated core domain-containing protein, partial [Betaproteobacteria bacterium]|nr:RHS repeat-associated core domain-containing protein [Betaproteobacteria bacterium]
EVDLFYVHADHLGTPRVITRPADNQKVWAWPNVDPFGNNVVDENPSGLGAFAYGLRFPGQYFDGETGGHYNYFRDYEPGIGRYLQSDPIGLEGGGPNQYAYVGSRPLTHVDPSGLIACKGEWILAGTDRQVGTYAALTNPIAPFCWCYWLCMDCFAPSIWSRNFRDLPRTRGIVTYTGGGTVESPRRSPDKPDRPGKPGQPGGPRGDFGDTCSCITKPGPQTGCECKAPPGFYD